VFKLIKNVVGFRLQHYQYKLKYSLTSIHKPNLWVIHLVTILLLKKFFGLKLLKCIVLYV